MTMNVLFLKLSSSNIFSSTDFWTTASPLVVFHVPISVIAPSLNSYTFNWKSLLKPSVLNFITPDNPSYELYNRNNYFEHFLWLSYLQFSINWQRCNPVPNCRCRCIAKYYCCWLSEGNFAFLCHLKRWRTYEQRLWAKLFRLLSSIQQSRASHFPHRRRVLDLLPEPTVSRGVWCESEILKYYKTSILIRHI